MVPQVKIYIKRQLLLIRIKDTRELMIMTAFKEGFTSPNTVKLSQSLDKMLNKLESTC
ncbi:aspartyl-phosphate phosphatase Spo0E family protein [Priestia aryabhattai]|uniref:aspartyl-phosphate phosphatase Spo0E family protein n=1 Tax=Priestia megaterium TaxID=1404 RepID=UPI0039B9C36B